MSQRPAVFFDRDGIANARPVRTRYVETPADFHLIPAFVDALRLARCRGYAVFVATNQRGVGRGIMTQEALDAVHAEFTRLLSAHGLALDEIRVCTANDDRHPNRKPNPGLLTGAAQDHGLDLHRSWMIGDSETDILAGRQAGCRTVLVSDSPRATLADYRVSDMNRLPALLERVLPDAKG